QGGFGGVVGGVSGGVVGMPPARPDQPARDSQPVTGRSTLRGRVLAADNGQPLRRATIRITAPELGGQRMTLTDNGGRYEFRELPQGRYTISASKPSFVGRSSGQTQQNGSSRTVALGDNQVVENIDVRLERGGVVTGRVVDEYGEPVPDL